MEVIFMFFIRINHRTGYFGNKFVTKIGAKTIKGIGVWELACLPLQDTCKRFKTEAEAWKLLQRFGWVDGSGEAADVLKRQGFTGFSVVTLEQIKEEA
jgi:hypothetical protein